MHIFVTWKKKTKADRVQENRKGTKRVTGEGKIKEQVFFSNTESRLAHIWTLLMCV